MPFSNSVRRLASLKNSSNLNPNSGRSLRLSRSLDRIVLKKDGSVIDPGSYGMSIIVLWALAGYACQVSVHSHAPWLADYVCSKLVFMHTLERSHDSIALARMAHN